MIWDDVLVLLRGQRKAIVGGGADDSAVEEAERRLCVRFPESLRSYVRKLGWVEAGSLEFYGLGAGVPRHLDIVRLCESEWSDGGLPRTLIPVLNDGGGNLYCVDTNGAGAVVYWDHSGGPVAQTATRFDEWFRERVDAVTRET